MRLWTPLCFILLVFVSVVPIACTQDEDKQEASTQDHGTNDNGALDAVLIHEPAQAAIDASGFDGAMLIYDAAKNTYTGAYPELASQPFIPASTFKIFSTLVALETGVIEGKDSIIAWDGVTRSREEINEDLDLQSAFRVSAVPHYQHLVREIGDVRMQKYMDEAGYGNQDISGGIDQFWLTGGLRITASQQIEFLMRLYRDELPFSQKTMTTVKEIMEHEVHDNYLIRAKTGWGIPDGSSHFGWWVGWVEKGDNVYAFATVLTTQTPGDSFGAARIAITKKVLAELGITKED